MGYSDANVLQGSTSNWDQQDQQGSSAGGKLNLAQHLNAIATGHFDDVALEGPESNDALRLHARQMQDQTLALLKLLITMSVSMSELMSLSAWSHGNAQKLSREANAVSTAMEDIAESVHGIARLSTSASQQTDEAQALSMSSVERDATAQHAITGISEAFASLNGRLHTLNNAMESIGGFANEIEDISNQTKLLALNATIEAARAGEAGKGFAVVAAEVKSLSEQTSKTTEKISRQLALLGGVMTGMTEAMTVGGERVEEGSSSFNAVVEDIGNMRQCIEVANNEIGSMSDMANDQSQTIDSIVKNISEIAKLAENNSKDSNGAIKLIKENVGLIETKLDDFKSMHVPNQAVWRIRSDHQSWKQQLAECLVGLRKPEEIQERLSLPLGPWYAQIDDPQVREHDAYAALSPLHAELKETGMQVVQEMSKNNVGNAIGAFFSMEENSNKVLSHLTELEAAISNRQS